jgi:archaellum component FlaG (FlaF/FlaG flagellin family)
MSDNRQKLVHLRSAVEKIPQASDLNYGEIAIQYAKSKPVLYIKNTDNEIVKFIDEAAINTLLNGYVTSGYLTTNYATSAETEICHR